MKLVQRSGPGLLAVPNVTAHPSTASVQSPYCCIMVRCSAPTKGLIVN